MEINELINVINKKIGNEIFIDHNGEFKDFEIKSSAKTYNYTGKKVEDLSTEEMELLKEKCTELLENLEKYSEKDIEAVKKCSHIFSKYGTRVTWLECMCYSRLIEENLIYAYIPIRGGASIIMDSNSMEYLWASSAVSFEMHLQAFKDGRRTEE